MKVRRSRRYVNGVSNRIVRYVILFMYKLVSCRVIDGQRNIKRAGRCIGRDNEIGNDKVIVARL